MKTEGIIKQKGYRREDLSPENRYIIETFESLIDSIDLDNLGLDVNDPDAKDPIKLIEAVKEYLTACNDDLQVALADSQDDLNDDDEVTYETTMTIDEYNAIYGAGAEPIAEDTHEYVIHYPQGIPGIKNTKVCYTKIVDDDRYPSDNDDEDDDDKE